MTGGGKNGIFQVGDILNNTYKIDQVLGRGGTSEVYRARSEISGRVVALKALRLEYSRNEDFLALMTREEEMREIRHDAVVRYYDNQRTDSGLVYLVMDYVEGPGLDQKIKQGRMSADDLLVVARRVTEGLIAAHAKNIVHRDLSPDNIILRHGKPSDAVIIDFGIAKDTNPGAETIVGNEFAGKYAYAAPEQLNGQTDARVDIYALGALLLSSFEGKAPDIGNNPMEVIKRKGLPLDTSRVPEPLKSLIDKMTVPDRELRLQTAKGVLAEIDSPTLSAVDAAPLDFGDDSDRTVIAPLPKRTKSKPPPPPPPSAPSGSGGGLLYAGLAVLVLGGIGGGAYFSGVLDGAPAVAALPVADPYSLVAARSAIDPPQIFGSAPSEETRTAMMAVINGLGGSGEITLASGDIPDGWGADMVQVLQTVSAMPEWSVVADGATVKISGVTDDPDQLALISSQFDLANMPASLNGSTDISLRLQLLQTSDLTPILQDYADCGPLSLTGGPVLGYDTDTMVTVTGKLSDADALNALTNDLSAVTGPRPLAMSVEVLNPTLCLIAEALPNAPSAGVGVVFSNGADGSSNPDGQFFVGENPVIDIVIPAAMIEGFLFVSALDVSGNVFHLLPNLLLPDNSMAALRNGTDGPVTIRLAHPLEDAQDGSKLAFTVDDSTLGKTQIVMIDADSQIFGGLRPTTESASGYAAALQERSGTILSLDSRILTTALP